MTQDKYLCLKMEEQRNNINWTKEKGYPAGQTFNLEAICPPHRVGFGKM